MRYSSECLKIDISTSNQSMIEFKQNSKESRFFHIQLLKKKFPVNLSNCKITLFYRKSNGKCLEHSAEIINAKSGLVQAYITDELVADFGLIDGEIIVEKGDIKFIVSPFLIKVIRSLHQTDINKPSLDGELIAEEIKRIKEDIGEIDKLQTDSAESVVDAINSIEIKTQQMLSNENSLTNKEIDRILSIFKI